VYRGQGRLHLHWVRPRRERRKRGDRKRETRQRSFTRQLGRVRIALRTLWARATRVLASDMEPVGLERWSLGLAWARMVRARMKPGRVESRLSDGVSGPIPTGLGWNEGLTRQLGRCARCVPFWTRVTRVLCAVAALANHYATRRVILFILLFLLASDMEPVGLERWSLVLASFLHT
jgi:hypothetical protein